MTYIVLCEALNSTHSLTAVVYNSQIKVHKQTMVKQNIYRWHSTDNQLQLALLIFCCWMSV